MVWIGLTALSYDFFRFLRRPYLSPNHCSQIPNTCASGKVSIGCSYSRRCRNICVGVNPDGNMQKRRVGAQMQQLLLGKLQGIAEIDSLRLRRTGRLLKEHRAIPIHSTRMSVWISAKNPRSLIPAYRKPSFVIMKLPSRRPVLHGSMPDLARVYVRREQNRRLN